MTILHPRITSCQVLDTEVTPPTEILYFKSSAFFLRQHEYTVFCHVTCSCFSMRLGWTENEGFCHMLGAVVKDTSKIGFHQKNV